MDKVGMRYVIRNIERYHAMGGDPSEHDRGCVLDMQATEKHPLTGESQQKAVYFGTIAECARWINQEERA